MRWMTALLMASLVLLGACSSDGTIEASIEGAAAEEGIDLDLDLGASASLPDDFPSSFPLPPGASPASSASSEGAFFVWFSGGGDVEAFYDTALDSSGWSVISRSEIEDPEGSPVTFILFGGNGYGGAIYFGRGGPAASFGQDFTFFVTMTPDEE